jgi:hypothetical protein
VLEYEIPFDTNKNDHIYDLRCSFSFIFPCSKTGRFCLEHLKHDLISNCLRIYSNKVNNRYCLPSKDFVLINKIIHIVDSVLLVK